MQKFLTAKQLHEAAKGRWLKIFDAVSPALVDALEAGGSHCACPVHGGQDGFRLFEDANDSGAGICNTCGHKSGVALIAWAEDIDYLKAKDLVANYLELLPEHAEKPIIPPTAVKSIKRTFMNKKGRDPKIYRHYLNAVWKASLPIDHKDAEPLRLYMARRGMSIKVLNPKVFRFHPGLEYFDAKHVLVGKFPALISKIDTVHGQAVTLHRTYLNENGEKAMEDAKKIAPYDKDSLSLTGAAIQLTRPGELLCVGEGIETMLSVLHATRAPTWAATTHVLLANLEIPVGVKELWIWADKDANGVGEEAARKLCMRAWAAGVQARILMPAGQIRNGKKSLDWNDVLIQDGIDAFPRVGADMKLKKAA